MLKSHFETSHCVYI